MNIWKCFLRVDTSKFPNIRQLIQDFESDLQSIRKSPINYGVESSIQTFKEYALNNCNSCVKISLEAWDKVYDGLKNDPERKSSFMGATKNIVVSETNLLTLATLFDKSDTGKELRALGANNITDMIVIQLTVSEN